MLLGLRAHRDAHQGRVRRGRPRRRPHVRRRGAGLSRGPAGPAVRRPGRQAPRAAARVHRHRRASRSTSPTSSRAARRTTVTRVRRRSTPAGRTSGGRSSSSGPRSSARWATSRPSSSAATSAASPRSTASRGRPRSPGTGSTCTRSSIRRRRSTPRPIWRRSKRTSCGCPSSWLTSRRSPGKRRPCRRPRSGRRGSRRSA